MGKCEKVIMIGLDGGDALFTKKMVNEGRLPAMKQVIENGAVPENLDMLGVLPTVTPTNWATLCTGTYPDTHGVTCFQNHTLGKSLGILENNWDSRRMYAESIWEAFEKKDKRCLMLNYCQAWPNRVKDSKNIFIDGTGVEPFLRCTADFQKIIEFGEEVDVLKIIPHFVDQNTSDCVVYGDQIEKFTIPDGDIKGMVKAGLFTEGAPLLENPAFVIMDFSPEDCTKEDIVDKVYSPLKAPKGWQEELPEDAKVFAYPANKGLNRHYAVVTKSAESNVYDTISFYENKKSKPLGSAKVGEWSDWLYCKYLNDDNEVEVAYKMRVVDLNEDGSAGHIYMSHTMKIDVSDYIYPKSFAKEFMDAVGPMLPHALYNHWDTEARKVLLESFEQNMDWHIRAAKYMIDKYDDWGLFYTHLHGIDLVDHWYINNAIEGTRDDWKENYEMICRIYEIQDAFVAAMLPYLEDDKTAIVITSDHGLIPRSATYANPGLCDLSGINCKVMSDLGYTTVHPVPNMPDTWYIDWSKTKAIQERSSYIYINLKGRDPEGIVEPEEYDDLVQQIIDDLYAYRDPIHGERVISFAMTREEAKQLGVGGDHVGDIFFQVKKDFGIEHAMYPSYVTNHGFSLAALCMMCGAGIKKGETIERQVRAVDIVPTICALCDVNPPSNVEGGVIHQAFENFKEMKFK